MASTAKAYTYASRVVECDYMSLNGGGLFGSGFKGVVVRSDGVEVWSGRIYRERGRGVLTQANLMLPRFRDYYAKHGRCWKDDQLAKRDLRRERIKARSAVLHLASEMVRHGVDAYIDGKHGCPHKDEGPERVGWNLGWHMAHAAKLLSPEVG